MSQKYLAEMQEQLLEKRVPEYPVSGPNPSPHHCFQNCKQQTGRLPVISLCICSSLTLSFCSLIALLLLFPRFFLLFPSDCSPESDILTLSLDLLWLIVPFFAATSFCSPALLQPALFPPFTHIYRTWQDAENSHFKRNWWHVLGVGSGHRLQKQALPSWRWRISFNENECNDYLGRKKENPPNYVILIRERFQEVCHM